MKKNSILLIMFISLFFIFDKNVFAIGSCTCVYGTDDLAIKVELSDSSIPKVSFTGTAVTGSTIAAVSLGSNNFAPVNFQDTASKKWKCPSTIYYNITTVGAAIKYTNLSTNENIGGAVSSFSLLSEKSSDGDYYEDVSDNSNEEVTLSYKVVINDKQIQILYNKIDHEISSRFLNEMQNNLEYLKNFNGPTCDEIENVQDEMDDIVKDTNYEIGTFDESELENELNQLVDNNNNQKKADEKCYKQSGEKKQNIMIKYPL